MVSVGNLDSPALPKSFLDLRGGSAGDFEGKRRVPAVAVGRVLQAVTGPFVLVEPGKSLQDSPGYLLLIGGNRYHGSPKLGGAVFGRGFRSDFVGQPEKVSKCGSERSERRVVECPLLELEGCFVLVGLDPKRDHAVEKGLFSPENAQHRAAHLISRETQKIATQGLDIDRAMH